jgi:hypothetical protein
MHFYYVYSTLKILVIGYFVFGIGTIFHLLPAFVLISVLIRFIKNRYVLLDRSEIIEDDLIDFGAVDVFY